MAARRRPPAVGWLGLVALFAVGRLCRVCRTGVQVAGREVVSPAPKSAWLIGLWVAAIAVQVMVPMGAADGLRPQQVGGGQLPARLGRLFQGRPSTGDARSLEVPGGVSRVDSAARTRCTSARIRRA